MQVRAASDVGLPGNLSHRTPRAPLTSRNETRRPLPKEINNRPPGIAAAAAAYAAQTPRRALSARPSMSSSQNRRMSVGGTDPLAPFGYQTMSPIAQGAFSQVARARHLSTKREVAVKTFNKQKIAKEPHLVQAMKNELDVLRAQQLVAQAESQFFDSQAGVEDGRDRLTFLMGRPTSERFDVRVDIPRPESEPIDAVQATTLALGNRLDLRSRVALRDDAENQIRFTKNQLLPQVDVNLALTRRETADSFRTSFAMDGYQFATFFTIAMPVDRTAQQVDYQSAVLDRDQRRREVATLERQISDDVKQALRERDRLLRGVISAETSVEIGRREVEVAQMRYQTGLSNNLDVVTAESGLLAAEGRRIQALADSAVAKLRLRALLGIFNPRTDLTDSMSAVPPIKLNQ